MLVWILIILALIIKVAFFLSLAKCPFWLIYLICSDDEVREWF